MVENGYVPIVVYEFKTLENFIHDHALLLLHNCRHAIFDISTKGGHLMEIERTLEYKTHALFICEEAQFSSLSGMLKSVGQKTQTFRTYRDVKRHIDEFFNGKI